MTLPQRLAEDQQDAEEETKHTAKDLEQAASSLVPTSIDVDEEDVHVWLSEHNDQFLHATCSPHIP